MKVLIVDDHPIVVSGCRALFQAEPDITLLEAANGAEALAVSRKNLPDVYVIDVNLPGMSGLELARLILQERPDARLLMLSMNDDPIFIAEGIKAGAKGFVSKNGDPALIGEAVRKIAAGGIWLPDDIAAKLGRMSHATAASSDAAPALTSREIEILRYLVKGKSMAEIAVEIDVSYKTTALACARLREKLGARTQPELVSIALDRKLI